jgi:hypothetical protein
MAGMPDDQVTRTSPKDRPGSESDERVAHDHRQAGVEARQRLTGAERNRDPEPRGIVG